MNRRKGPAADEEPSQKWTTFQVVVVVLLLINTIILAAILMIAIAPPAVLEVASNDSIVLDIENVVGDNVTYGVFVRLRNTGGEIAYVSASGEVLVSLYGSAYGEEVLKVLSYSSTSISPGETKWLDFGSFSTAPGWHYVVQIHVSWNGGSMQLSRTVT